MAKTRNRSARLYQKIAMPVTFIIVALVCLLAVLSSVVIVWIQNDQTEKSVRQSTNYVYRSLWYQFNSLKNIPSFIISSREIENLLEKRYASKADAVSDYYDLFTEFENISLMSLLNEVDPRSQAQISYVVTVIVGAGSGLYDLATDRFATVNGIYKNDDVKDKDWYRKLSESGNPMVWWAEPGNADGIGGHIYVAKRKVSAKDGRELGYVVVGYALNNIRGVLNQVGLLQGEFVLADEQNRVVYGTSYPFGRTLPDSFTAGMNGQAQGEGQGLLTRKIDGEQTFIAWGEYDNGWKLISIVPESRLADYTAVVAAIAVGVSLLGIVVTTLLIRRVAAKVTVPVTRLASLMKRVELGELQPPARLEPAYIDEVDLLGRGFANMIARLNGLIEEVYVRDIAQKQLQLDLLHAQINPHFLYNTLDMINCKALDAGDRDISRIARLLATVLRFGLNKGQQVIALRDELKQVSSYLEIQAMMNGELLYNIQADESLSAEPVIHFVLQPLVENSMVHGFRQQRTNRRIEIRVERDDGDLLIEVHDNGCGADAERMNRLLAGEEPEAGSASETELPAQTSGLGVRNVERRIKLYCGDRYGLRYMPADSGTCVHVRLPLAWPGKSASDFSPG
ncbi:sensor histidine kinase [Paenibacillus hodogayensis]|uniref:Sensor histidine kinase n=1 Tax=Paenibacillus hodogayensis TaxID=279208 RepID=A0ABV5W6F2_9BACL